MNSKLISVIITASLVVLTGCRERKVAAKELPAVRVQTVALTELSRELRFAGSVEPVARVDLSFQVSGMVEEILQVRGLDGRPRTVEAGDTVAAGTLLAHVRAAEFQARTEAMDAQIHEAQAAQRAMDAQIAEAQAALAQAQLDWQRAQQLYGAQAMTKAEYDAVKARSEASQARVSAAEAQSGSLAARVRGLEALRRERAINQKDTALLAPFSGVIVQRRTERGAQAGPSVPVFTLADLSRVKVRFYVSDRALADFPRGASVQVVADALPGEIWTGRVESVSPSADAATRSYRVEAMVANAGLRLKDGMVVAVTHRRERTEPMPAIPLSAIVRLDPEGKSFAVFLLENGKLKRQRVVLGALVDSQATVVEGLRAGDRIVRDAVARLQDGESVRIIP